MERVESLQLKYGWEVEGDTFKDVFFFSRTLLGQIVCEETMKFSHPKIGVMKERGPELFKKVFVLEMVKEAILPVFLLSFTNVCHSLGEWCLP